MLKDKDFKIVTLIALILLVCSGIVFAAEDGFVAVKKIPGKHFTVFLESGVDVPALSKLLDIGSSERLLAGKSTETGFSPEQELADMVDTIFIRVCDILDMRLYSFEGDIKICRDNRRLGLVYRDLFGRDLNPTRAFYAQELNILYVSAQDFKSGILGHEIAHAVMSRYFVVQPSVKIQEILSGYVEYQLRKSPNTGPS